MLETLKQWAFTLVITAVVGGVASSLTISDSGGMKKYIKFACAIVALAVMIMPLKELFTELPQLVAFAPAESEYSESEIYDNYAERLNELTAAKTGELVKRRISDIVYEKTGIKPDDVYIYIGHKDYSEIDVEKIIIVGRDVLGAPQENNADPNAQPTEFDDVKLYLQQLFNCEVEIGDNIND